VSIESGMTRLLAQREELLAGGAGHLGWKVGFNLPALQQRLGLERPLAGFLTTRGLLQDGATWDLAESGPVLVECEVAVELGADGRSVAALLPALELADPLDLSRDLEAILAGNIFHRAVAFGPRVECGAPGAGRLLVNGREEHFLSPARTSAHLAEMIEAVGGRLADAGEALRPGDRIITGILAPPHPARPGDRVRLELEALGGVEVTFA
jgi:2-keto-4-pentenoate hydratase